MEQELGLDGSHGSITYPGLCRSCEAEGRQSKNRSYTLFDLDRFPIWSIWHGRRKSISLMLFWKRVWIVPAFVTGAHAASPYRYILAFVVPRFATHGPGALELFLAFPLSLSLLLMFMMRWGGDDVCYTTIFFFV
tara:strand:+ start:29535 stop:29939 length:405 start_codon:yes stop_codon:yes gene_type:complete